MNSTMDGMESVDRVDTTWIECISIVYLASVSYMWLCLCLHLWLHLCSKPKQWYACFPVLLCAIEAFARD